MNNIQTGQATGTAQSVSPGFDSSQAAQLTVSQSGAYATLSLPVALVPGIAYTMTLEYTQVPGMTCLIDSGGDLNFQFGIDTATGGQNNNGYTAASAGGIIMQSDTTPDSQGGYAGSWNMATLAPTFVASSRNHRVWVSLRAENCLGTVQVDNVQVLASFPVDQSSPLVYPNCTSLPTGPFTSVNITTTPSTKIYPKRSFTATINTYPNMSVVPNDVGSAVHAAGSLAACQKLLGAYPNVQTSAQYDNTTGICTIYQSNLCNAYELLEAGSSVFALGTAATAVNTM